MSNKSKKKQVSSTTNAIPNKKNDNQKQVASTPQTNNEEKIILNIPISIRDPFVLLQENTELRYKVKQLETELNELGKKCIEKDTIIRIKDEQIQVLLKDNHDLKLQVQQLKDEINELRKQTNMLRDDNIEMKHELRTIKEKEYLKKLTTAIQDVNSCVAMKKTSDLYFNECMHELRQNRNSENHYIHHNLQSNETQKQENDNDDVINKKIQILLTEMINNKNEYSKLFDSYYDDGFYEEIMKQLKRMNINQNCDVSKFVENRIRYYWNN